MQITLDIIVMAQVKVHRELAGLGADLTNSDIIEGYITNSKSKINSMVQDTGENNVLPPQGPTNNDNEEELASAATALSLLSPHNDNSNSQHLKQSHMKYY